MFSCPHIDPFIPAYSIHLRMTADVNIQPNLAVVISTVSETAEYSHCVITGFRGVSELRYRTNDSTALWESSFIDHPGIDYLYELSMVNGTVLKSSRVTETELHLPGLEESKSYILDVWEQCDGQWESKHSRLCFEGTNSSMAMLLRAAGPYPDKGQCYRCRCYGITSSLKIPMKIVFLLFNLITAI